MRVATSTHERAGWVVVALHGDADFHTDPQIAAALNEASTARPWVVVDCALLSFCDSSFLGTLVSVSKQAQTHGGTVVVAAAPDRLERQLGRTGLNRVIPSYRTVAEAVA